MAAYKSPLPQPAITPEQLKQDSKFVSKMLIAFMVVAILGGAAWMVFGQNQDGPQISAQARGEVSQLLTNPDFSAFDQALDQKIASGGVDREYLEALVDRIADPTTIDTLLPKNTYLPNQSPANPSAEARVLHHDVTMVGGRATYAIHRLTGKTLPTVRSTDDLTRLAQIKTQVAALVLH